METQEIIRILHLEDNSSDAELAAHALGKSFSITRVATREEFVAQLEIGKWHLILSDMNLPQFDGLTAPSIVREKNLNTPFVFLTAESDPKNIIEGFRMGAADYVLKDNLHTDLLPAINRALKAAEERRKVVPICGQCKKVRDDQSIWHQMEIFLLRNRGIRFSHTLCPVCLEKQMAEINAIPKQKQ